MVAGLRTALSLVLPFAGAQEYDPLAPASGRRWLVPIGLAIGLVYAALYRAAWRFFGESEGIRLMPAVAVWLLDVALCGSVLMFGAARVAQRIATRSVPPDPAVPVLLSVGTVVFVVVCTLKLMLWIAIPHGVSTWPGIWGSTLNFAYPHTFYRPLILAPMWGRWGVLLAAGLGRPAPHADPLVRGLMVRQSPATVLAWFLPVAVLTAVYCGYNAKWMYGAVIALGVMGVTYLYGVAVAYRLTGQSRDTLRAAGLIAELTFLILYTGFSVRVYTG